jgi:hypothetical protein
MGDRSIYDVRTGEREENDMKGKLIIAVVLGLLVSALPASAQVGFGIGYGPGYYGFPYYGSYGGVWGYPMMSPIYRSPEIRPSGGVPMIPGAVSYIDEGDYRNYRDAAGVYLGRVLLTEIASNRW